MTIRQVCSLAVMLALCCPTGASAQRRPTKSSSYNQFLYGGTTPPGRMSIEVVGSRKRGFFRTVAIKRVTQQRTGAGKLRLRIKGVVEHGSGTVFEKQVTLAREKHDLARRVRGGSGATIGQEVPGGERR